MYRQYRVGELPDIQIPYKALIAPFQAFAEVYILSIDIIKFQLRI